MDLFVLIALLSEDSLKKDDEEDENKEEEKPEAEEQDVTKNEEEVIENEPEPVVIEIMNEKNSEVSNAPLEQPVKEDSNLAEGKFF
jgi:hypothetical protein